MMPEHEYTVIDPEAPAARPAQTPAGPRAPQGAITMQELVDSGAQFPAPGIAILNGYEYKRNVDGTFSFSRQLPVQQPKTDTGKKTGLDWATAYQRGISALAASSAGGTRPPPPEFTATGTVPEGRATGGGLSPEDALAADPYAGYRRYAPGENPFAAIEGIGPEGYNRYDQQAHGIYGFSPYGPPQLAGVNIAQPGGGSATINPSQAQAWMAAAGLKPTGNVQADMKAGMAANAARIGRIAELTRQGLTPDEAVTTAQIELDARAKMARISQPTPTQLGNYLEPQEGFQRGGAFTVNPDEERRPLLEPGADIEAVRRAGTLPGVAYEPPLGWPGGVAPAPKILLASDYGPPPPLPGFTPHYPGPGGVNPAPPAPIPTSVPPPEPVSSAGAGYSPRERTNRFEHYGPSVGANRQVSFGPGGRPWSEIAADAPSWKAADAPLINWNTRRFVFEESLKAWQRLYGLPTLTPTYTPSGEPLPMIFSGMGRPVSFAHGGQLTIGEPSTVVGNYSGQPYASLAEGGQPERVTVEPLAPPAQPTQPQMTPFAQLMESLFRQNRGGRRPPPPRPAQPAGASMMGQGGYG